MTKLARLAAITAVLAAYAVAAADIQPRNLELEPSVRIEVADGRKVPCKVLRWDGLGLEGSCGVIRWNELKPAIAFSTLRAIVSERDVEACCDAATVVVSLDPNGIAAKPAIDWAKRCGADAARLERIRADADALAKLRADRVQEDRAERLRRITPEADAFSNRPWQSLHSADLDAASASSVEAARALLAKTGGSGNLHETAHIALLLEADSETAVKDAAFLERCFREWRDQFEKIGVQVADQGRIPVVVVRDRDRWRLLIQAATGGDAAQHPDAVTIYPKTGSPGERRPIVLVHPQSDPNLQRYNAAVGVARALLHLAASAERPPAWVNESLPKILADLAVPAAQRDLDFRKPALAAVRSGGTCLAVITSPYGQGAWMRDPALAQSVAYLFGRWLFEQSPERFLRYAKGPRTSEGEDARFKRVFGMSIDAANARACAWFATND